MDIFEFVVLSFCNLALIFWIIKRQGLASVEGYCAAWIGMAVLSDIVQLLFHYFFQPEALLLGVGEFSFRAFPTIVHIVGLLVLMAGLFLGNPKPEPISREFSAKDRERDFVAHTGVFLLLLGLIMAGIATYLTGAYRGPYFFEALDTFRGGDPGETGGFWYRGANIAVFGMALMLPSWGRRRIPFFLLLLAMTAATFFLRANKGGFEEVILWAALALHTYNPRRFWSLAKPRVALVCLMIGLIGIGIKVELLKKEAEPLTLETMSENIVGPVEGRWGDQGLYRGYCQFINLLPKYHYLFDGYREGMFALTEAWVPRALHPSKRTQPTVGLGFMIHADAHTYRDETPSIELVGSVYADNGFYSLTAYLLIVGFLLGILRRYAAGRRSPIQWHISYLSFALFGGLSAEAGITGIIYSFILTFAATGVAHVAVLGLYKRKLHVGAVPMHCVARGSLNSL